MNIYIIGAVHLAFDGLSGYDPDFVNTFKRILTNEYIARVNAKWDKGWLGNPHSILHDVAFDVLSNSREESGNWILDLLERAGDEDYALQYSGDAKMILEEITPQIGASRELYATFELAEIEAQCEAEAHRANFIGNSNVKANLRSYIRKLDNKGQFRVYKAVAEYIFDGLIPDMSCWRDCDKNAWETIQEGIERGPLFVGE